jgi:hypothetical protein
MRWRRRRCSCVQHVQPGKTLSWDCPEFDRVISVSDSNEKIVNTMDGIKDFVSKIFKQSLKQRLTASYFKKQLPNVQF